MTEKKKHIYYQLKFQNALVVLFIQHHHNDHFFY